MSEYATPVNQDLKSIDLQPYERYLPTAFNDSLSLLEKVNKVIYQLHDSNKVTIEVVENWNTFVTQLNEGKLIEVKINEFLQGEKIIQLIDEEIMRDFKNNVSERIEEKVDRVTQENSEIKFYSKDKLLQSIDVSIAGNTTIVQNYIDTLVTNGQIEGVRLGEGIVTPQHTNYIDIIKGVNRLNPSIITKDFYKTGSNQVAHNGAFYSGNIPVKSGDIVRCTYNSTYATNIGVVYDKNNVATLIRNLPDFAITDNKYWKATMPENASYMIVNGSFAQIGNKVVVTINESYPDTFTPYIQEYKLSESIKLSEKVVTQSNLSDDVLTYFLEILKVDKSSPLYQKIWAVCGDSLTYGAKADLDENGVRKTYQYFIGKRNNMNLTVNAISGSTMMNVESKNPFSVPGRYDSLGENLDYITLAFNTNDSAQGVNGLGTINDTTNTTFYGAWNIVMDYLINKYPKAKIGIIIFWGGSKSYRDAVREIAKKYGIPPLDFMGDMSIPLVAGKEEGMGVNYNIKEARKATFLGDTVHLNNTGYEYISTIVEDYMKKL